MTEIAILSIPSVERAGWKPVGTGGFPMMWWDSLS